MTMWAGLSPDNIPDIGDLMGDLCLAVADKVIAERNLKAAEESLKAAKRRMSEAEAEYSLVISRVEYVASVRHGG